ncbi:hypothetical protein BDI4_700061 [Burkholderia diffusa]|nr:hypothetical protein BDI4_700061 [Burkholderia diffusa]
MLPSSRSTAYFIQSDAPVLSASTGRISYADAPQMHISLSGTPTFRVVRNTMGRRALSERIAHIWTTDSRRGTNRGTSVAGTPRTP